jgi:hypothetical protein
MGGYGGEDAQFAVALGRNLGRSGDDQLRERQRPKQTTDYDDEQHPHTVVVFIDNNLGAIVKDVFVGPPVDRVLEAYQRGGRVTIRTVRPPTAAGITVPRRWSTRSEVASSWGEVVGITVTIAAVPSELKRAGGT